ncbi:hypothetical protein [Parabacteroides sp. PF5-9]|uniref:hypothetical protein n=1 Tax=Parabacteroides sp. PF5-9 TaxID=1742404 RepID=UPI0024751AA7|nr:hypothetical protein [Parabacteroides sp. PF5-9]MDH6357288.1 hypothetical protein [Parabacteroides sp. PF5-9]
MSHDWRKLQEKFIALMKGKSAGNLAQTIAELLPLEKEAIYRRLRADVPFSFSEYVTLSSQLGISLDSLTDFTSPYRSQSFQLHIRDYSQFTPVDLYMSESYIKVIHRAADNPYSEFGIAANTLPLHISLLHLPLYRVYILKWRYQFDMNSEQPLHYLNIKVPPEEEATYAGYLEGIQRIKYTYFIWDSNFLMSLINDINYFYEIQLIDKESMYLLKQEMERLLNTLEYYADRDIYNTENKVEMYISLLNFDTTYNYLSSGDIHVSMSTVYGLGAYTSLEKEACDSMKKWIQGLKKTSTLISGISQLDRIRFFKQQRELLEQHFKID